MLRFRLARKRNLFLYYYCFSISTAIPKSSAIMSSQSNQIHLLDLAASAVSCTVTASKHIRRLEELQNARLKPDGSFVTDADLTAQAVIFEAFQRSGSTVRMVGEESPSEMAQHKVEPLGDEDALWRRTREELELVYNSINKKDTELPDPMPLAQGLSLSDPWNEPAATQNNDPELLVDASRVSIIVDPLDGTKSYTTGETEVVSILIGITLDDVPHFGVVGKPFGYPTLPNMLDSTCATLYGGPLLGQVYCAGRSQPIPRPVKCPQPRAVISKSRSEGVVQDFCVHLGTSAQLIHPEPLLVNGAGEKSLRLILQPSSCEALWFFPKGGTSLWDVAAPDALLRVLGGKLTDKYGEPLDYKKSREEAENKKGVVACIDEELHSVCIDLFQRDGWLERE